MAGSFAQRVADAKSNYRQVETLRDLAQEAADAANSAERMFQGGGGVVTPELDNQISNDYNIVMFWFANATLPNAPQPGGTTQQRIQEALEWEKIGKKVAKDLDDYDKNGVAKAVQRLISAARTLNRAIDRLRGVPDMGPAGEPVAGNPDRPNPHNTNPTLQRPRPFNAGQHGAQLGFNAGSMKGTSGTATGSVGAGGGGGYGGSGGAGQASLSSPEGQSAQADTFNVGGNNPGPGPGPGPEPGPGPKPDSGPETGPATGPSGGGPDVITGADPQAPQSTGPAPTTADADTPSPGAGGGGGSPTDGNESDEHPEPPAEAAPPPPPKDPPVPGDKPGSGGSPNPDDGSDESPHMHGLSRYARRRPNRFTNQGFAPTQTSAVVRLLEYSSGHLGDEGGGVNPRFFNADPSPSNGTSRGGRVADPDGEGDNAGAGLAGGIGFGDTAGGPTNGVGGSDPEGGSAAADMGSVAGGVPTGPDPDNEWGAGGYNPHYQPQGGYSWTPNARTGSGTTRVQPTRVRARFAAGAIRFK